MPAGISCTRRSDRVAGVLARAMRSGICRRTSYCRVSASSGFVPLPLRWHQTHLLDEPLIPARLLPCRRAAGKRRTRRRHAAEGTAGRPGRALAGGRYGRCWHRAGRPNSARAVSDRTRGGFAVGLLGAIGIASAFVPSSSGDGVGHDGAETDAPAKRSAALAGKDKRPRKPFGGWGQETHRTRA